MTLRSPDGRSGIRENSGFTPDSGLTAYIRATGNLSGNYVTLNNHTVIPEKVRMTVQRLTRIFLHGCCRGFDSLTLRQPIQIQVIGNRQQRWADKQAEKAEGENAPITPRKISASGACTPLPINSGRKILSAPLITKKPQAAMKIAQPVSPVTFNQIAAGSHSTTGPPAPRIKRTSPYEQNGTRHASQPEADQTQQGLRGRGADDAIEDAAHRGSDYAYLPVPGVATRCVAMRVMT